LLLLSHRDKKTKVRGRQRNRADFFITIDTRKGKDERDGEGAV